jgi:hypothetical protein
MQQHRFTRLINGFSRKPGHHMAAVALYVALYNLCRIHEALRITHAMHLRVHRPRMGVREFVHAALTGEILESVGCKMGRFAVFDGANNARNPEIGSSPQPHCSRLL